MQTSDYTIEPGAGLVGADLHAADLYGAELARTWLHAMVGAVDLGTDPRGYHFVAVRHADGWRVKAGCRWFTVAAAVAHWTARENRDALARVAILQARE